MPSRSSSVGGVARLAHARRLGHPQRDPAAAGHHHRVVHVDRVDLAVERRGDLDLRPEPASSAQNSSCWRASAAGVGRAPRGAGPVAGGGGAADEHPPQRGDHRRDAVGGRVGSAHAGDSGDFPARRARRSGRPGRRSGGAPRRPSRSGEERVERRGGADPPGILAHGRRPGLPRASGGRRSRTPSVVGHAQAVRGGRALDPDRHHVQAATTAVGRAASTAAAAASPEAARSRRPRRARGRGPAEPPASAAA